MVGGPLEDGGVIQGPQADLLYTNDVDVLDSTSEPEDDVLIDVLVGEESRGHAPSLASSVVRLPSGG